MGAPDDSAWDMARATDSDSDIDDERMRAPSIGASAVMGEVKRLSGASLRAVAKGARKLTGTHDEDSDDDDDKYGDTDGKKGGRAVARCTQVSCLLLLGAAISLCTVGLHLHPGASGGTRRQLAGAGQPPPPRASTGKQSGGGTSPPQRQAMGRDKLHVAKARAAIGAGGERAAAAALVLEKHEKVMHMQVVQAAEGTPVRVACTSDADMHLLGTLEAGETLDIVCPPGCEWQAWVVKQMKNNTAVWGGTTGYASRSLVCVAGFQETGSHAGGPYRVLITHNDKGSAGREIHGVTSLDWTESGFGYLIYNLAGLDEEEKRMLDETLADQVYYVKPPPTRGVQRERNELEHSTLEASAADDAHVNVSDSDLEDLHSYYNDEL